MRLRRILTAAVAAGALGVAAPAITAAPAQAAGITECGNWVFTGNNVWHGYWTFRTVLGFTPVANLTTRGVRCSDARRASLNIMRYYAPPFGSHRNTYWHGFTLRWIFSNGEDWDVRGTRGSQVIHWQGGA